MLLELLWHEPLRRRHPVVSVCLNFGPLGLVERITLALIHANYRMTKEIYMKIRENLSPTRITHANNKKMSL